MKQLVDESIQEHFQVLITNYNEGPEDQEHTFIVQANLGMDIMPGASDPLGAGRLAQRALFLHRDQFQNTYRLYLQIRAIIYFHLPTNLYFQYKFQFLPPQNSVVK